VAAATQCAREALGSSPRDSGRSASHRDDVVGTFRQRIALRGRSIVPCSLPATGPPPRCPDSSSLRRLCSPDVKAPWTASSGRRPATGWRSRAASKAGFGCGRWAAAYPLPGRSWPYQGCRKGRGAPRWPPLQLCPARGNTRRVRSVRVTLCRPVRTRSERPRRHRELSSTPR